MHKIEIPRHINAGIICTSIDNHAYMYMYILVQHNCMIVRKGNNRRWKNVICIHVVKRMKLKYLDTFIARTYLCT